MMITGRKTSPILYLIRRSLIAKVQGNRVPNMFGRFLGRQVAALIVALGVFLSGSAPAWANPASSGNSVPAMTMTMMPGMTMDSSCMESGKAMPGKQAPCKGSDSSCAVCTSCAVNVALVLDLVPVTALYQHNSGLIGADVNPDGIVSPPALPPPILHA